MTLIAVVDVYGRKSIVSREDLESPTRWIHQVPLRDLKGRTFFSLGYARKGKACTIHRQNIARVMEL
jgi:hypothetical protein